MNNNTEELKLLTDINAKLSVFDRNSDGILDLSTNIENLNLNTDEVESKLDGIKSSVDNITIIDYSSQLSSIDGHIEDTIAAVNNIPDNTQNISDILSTLSSYSNLFDTIIANQTTTNQLLSRIAVLLGGEDSPLEEGNEESIRDDEPMVE